MMNVILCRCVIRLLDC